MCSSDLHIASLSCGTCRRNVQAALAGETRIAALEVNAGRLVVRLVLAETAAPTDSFVQRIRQAGYVATPVVADRMYRWALAGDDTAPLRAATEALQATPGVRGTHLHRSFLKVTFEEGRIGDAEILAVARTAAPRLRPSPVEPEP